MKKRIALLVSTLALVALAGVAQAASTMFAVQNGSAQDQMVVQDNGYIGVGTTAPGAPIHLKATGLFPANIIKIEGNEITKGAGLVAYSNRSDGVTMPLAADRLGFIFFGGVLAHPAGIAAAAEADHTLTSWPTYFALQTTAAGSTTRVERFRITGSGNVGINTTAPTSKLHVVGLPTFADNASALAGGLTAGAFYRTATGVLMVAF
jgi:hypothetical protein